MWSLFYAISSGYMQFSCVLSPQIMFSYSLITYFPSSVLFCCLPCGISQQEGMLLGFNASFLVALISSKCDLKIICDRRLCKIMAPQFFWKQLKMPRSTWEFNWGDEAWEGIGDIWGGITGRCYFSIKAKSGRAIRLLVLVNFSSLCS